MTIASWVLAVLLVAWALVVGLVHTTTQGTPMPLSAHLLVLGPAALIGVITIIGAVHAHRASGFGPRSWLAFIPVLLVAWVVIAFLVMAVEGRRRQSDDPILVFQLQVEAPSPAPRDAQHVRGPGGEELVLAMDPVVRNQDIVAATAEERGNGFIVTIQLTPEGSAKLHAAKQVNQGRRMAVLVTGKALVAPVIRDVAGREVVIDAGLSREEARRIARGLTPRS